MQINDMDVQIAFVAHWSQKTFRSGVDEISGDLPFMLCS